jgi:hypothetical protein
MHEYDERNTPGESRPTDEPPRFTEADPIEGDAADSDPATLIRGVGGVGYALATTDDTTGVWYVAAGGSLGNPIRTRHAASVRIWPNSDAVRAWVSNLPDLTRRRLAARRLTIVPLRMAVMFGESFEQIHLAVRTGGDDGEAPDPSGATAEYVLCYRPPGRRRRVKRTGREWRQP